MLKTLIKKQIAEIFRSYFYNPKTGKARSKVATAGFIALFVVLIGGMFGGLFSFLGMTVCPTAVAVQMDWFYFLIMGGLSIVLGAFGSVFNTYAGLYLSKDNDLLLSMPIPVKSIMLSRLSAVYVMDLIYSGCASIPMVIVYWVVKGITFENAVCGLMAVVVISVFVMTISCALGYVLAVVSKKLKNKSFVTVLVALAGIAIYYVLYYRAMGWIQELIANMAVYGAVLEGKARFLTLLGRASYEFLPMLGTGAAVFALFGLCWYGMRRSFMGIATAVGSVSRAKAKKENLQKRSLFSALLEKEFLRLASSPNYMLNCCLGVVVLPALGVALLLKHAAITEAIGGTFGAEAFPVLIAAALCMAGATIDAAAPSVSLEGKAFWQLQAMPVDMLTVIKAKMSVQMFLSFVPLAVTLVLVAIAVPLSVTEMALVILTSLLFAMFASLLNMWIAVEMPSMNWTNEITPIKQSMGVLVALLGIIFSAVAIGLVYLVIGYRLGSTVYLSVVSAILLAAGLVLWRLLKTAGVRSLEQL